jgi:radical SAM family uncharacterized protein/radical SAM-linked protein
MRNSKLIGEIERPSRYLGVEHGLPPMPVDPKLVVAMGFPDVYEVGMSHLGFRLLHAGLASRGDIQVERVFLPWPDLQAALRRHDEVLTTLERELPLDEVDLLGLSVPYELGLTAVLRLLDLARLPRRAADRADRRAPLVLVGGGGALNPEPLAPFVDAFFVGEADHALHEIVDALIATRSAPRAARLEALGRVSGIYIPEWYAVEHGPGVAASVVARAPGAASVVHRRVVDDLDALPLPSVSLVPTCTVVHDRVAIEIQRGCCQGCRFCQAGFVSRPTRQRNAERVLELARAQLAQTGYEDLSLLSLSAGDHGQLQQMLGALIAEHGPARVAVSLPSLRTDTLGPAIAGYVSKVRKATFTLAPEAGSDRLRRVINKGNTEENLLESVRAVARAGFQQIKLYFMIGLPTETDDDVTAIAELAARAQQAAQAVSRVVRITVSVSTFVPKPHTPFQWEAAPDLQTIQRKQALLQGRMTRRIKLKWHDPGQSLVEAYLARADRRMAAVLERVVAEDHTGLDAWTEHFDLRRWEQALAEAHRAGEIPSPELYLGAREVSAPLPWDHIDVGVERAYLARDRAAALAEGTRPDCSDGSCDLCGVCPGPGAPLHRRVPRSTEPAPALAAPDDTPAQDEGAKHKTTVRVWFDKLDRARLISHLEMAGVFERAARRARLPLAFSDGYHPKPKLRFTPALPLGAESRCELVELPLSEPRSPEQVGAALAAQLPPGLEVRRCEEAAASLLPQIRGIRWRFTLEGAVDLAASLERARAALRAGARTQRRGGREVDLTAIVLDLVALDDACFEARCAFAQDGTVRPAELLKALLGLDDEAAARTQIVRVGWILDGGIDAPLRGDER